MNIFIALLTLATGLALVFWGFGVARIIIPLWGFVSGMSIGAGVAANMAGTPFLGTTLGILIGLFFGVVFALLAYFFYAATVLVLAGALGFWLGSGFFLMLGFHPGLLSTLAGLTLGIFAGIGALLINAPKYVLIVFTSLAGAVAAVGSILLLFNQMPYDIFSMNVARVVISNSVFWTIATVTLAVVGMVVQAILTDHYELMAWEAPEQQSHSQHPTVHHA